MLQAAGAGLAVHAMPSAAGPAPDAATPSPSPLPKRPRIAMITPNSEGNTFWPQVFGIMEHAAQTLGFEFTTHSLGVDDRYERQRQTLQIISDTPRPDAVIVNVVVGQSKPMMEAAEAAGVPVFVMGSIFPSELPAIGQSPRRRYPHWAGSFESSEEEKGYALAKALIHEAARRQAVAADKLIHVVGVGGDTTWFGSGQREAGLVRAVAEHPDAVLKQVVPTRWTQREGRVLAGKLLKRYPQASVVWAASDQLGAGAVQAIEDAGRQAGTEVFTGGQDMSDLGLRLVQDGRFVATAASSMLCIGQMATMVYDYACGIDFAAETGTEVMFPIQVASRATAEQHLRFTRCVYAIDFRTFSKVHNPSLKQYDFSQEAFRRAARACT